MTLDQAERMRQFGERFKRLRISRGWSQRSLAIHTGLGQGNISTFEKGRRFPEAVSLELLADALGVCMENLWRGFCKCPISAKICSPIGDANESNPPASGAEEAIADKLSPMGGCPAEFNATAPHEEFGAPEVEPSFDKLEGGAA